MHEAKCPSPVYVILTTHTTRDEYLQDDDVQMRRVGRTTDIALRVNAQTKREIGSVQKDMQKQIESVQKHMSDQISELKGLMQQVVPRTVGNPIRSELLALLLTDLVGIRICEIEGNAG